MIQISDSTAILILASIAGVYFMLTAACSVVICRIVWKKRSASSNLSRKFPGSTHNQYEVTHVVGSRVIKDRSDLVPGGRAGKWRQYLTNQPLRCNGTTSHHRNGSAHYNYDRPKLPAIEEVGEGVSMWIGEGREDEEEEGSSGEHLEQTTATESAMKHQWMAKRKVRGRTSSTKFLLEETDGSSSWTLTSTNGTNGSLVDEMESSLNLTASLPGSALAQCGRSDNTTTPIPRPVAHRNSHVPINTRSESPPEVTGTASSPRPISQPGSTGVDHALNQPPVTKQPVRRTHKQLSGSTHSLPRHSTITVDHQTSVGAGSGTLSQGGLGLSQGGSDALPPSGVSGGGSRPKLRRYASTAPYTSSPSLGLIVLVKPRSGSRRRRSLGYQSNTLGRSSFPEHHSSVTSVEMERNYYTLQTRRGVNDGEEKREEGGREGTVSAESVGMEERLTVKLDAGTDQKYVIRMDNQPPTPELPIQGTDQKTIIRMDDQHPVPTIDLDYDGQDASEV